MTNQLIREPGIRPFDESVADLITGSEPFCVKGCEPYGFRRYLRPNHYQMTYDMSGETHPLCSIHILDDQFEFRTNRNFPPKILKHMRVTATKFCGEMTKRREQYDKRCRSLLDKAIPLLGPVDQRRKKITLDVDWADTMRLLAWSDNADQIFPGPIRLTGVTNTKAYNFQMIFSIVDDEDAGMRLPLFSIASIHRRIDVTSLIDDEPVRESMIMTSIELMRNRMSDLVADEELINLADSLNKTPMISRGPILRSGGYLRIFAPFLENDYLIDGYAESILKESVNERRIREERWEDLGGGLSARTDLNALGKRSASLITFKDREVWNKQGFIHGLPGGANTVASAICLLLDKRPEMLSEYDEQRFMRECLMSEAPDPLIYQISEDINQIGDNDYEI